MNYRYLDRANVFPTQLNPLDIKGSATGGGPAAGSAAILALLAIVAVGGRRTRRS